MSCEEINNNAAPIFTPPAPTFEPPMSNLKSETCYYHHSEPAVEKCARCGKYICEDCYNNYRVDGGEYAGLALCYDCCRELVAANVTDLTKNKKKIKRHFILSIVGMVIGFILGLISGISEGSLGAGLILALIYAGVGGVFASFMKFYFQCIWEAVKASFKAFLSGGIWAILGVFFVIVFHIFVEMFKSIFYTIKNTIDYIKYLKETDGFIESDSAALQEMADYMEYTMIRNQNKGVDLETLLNQNSELSNNSYARMVREQGESQAEANIRTCVASINENGEIIRSFAA